MSISAFNDALGNLVAAALHRRITDGEQDWYDITPSSVIGDMLPQPVFAHIPMTYVITAPEYAVMDRLQDLLGTSAKAMLAGMGSGSDTLTLYTISRHAAEEDFIPVPTEYQPEDQEEGYYFDETQAQAEETQAEETQAEVKPEYNHPHWPSPRAVRFAKALGAESWPWKTEAKRLTHVQALEKLAAHARITVDALRSMRPTDYMAKHMGPRAQWALKTVYGGPYKLY